MSRNLIIFILSFFLCSCSLTRSSIVNSDPTNDAIAILSIKFVYNGQSEPIDGKCYIRFRDEDAEPLKVRHEKNSSIYIIKSERGRIIAESVRCSHYELRNFDISEWIYFAHPGFINYAGHVTIDYRASEFTARDVFGLGGLQNDSKGKVEIRVEDRIEDIVDFIDQHYPELKNRPITKSFFDDVLKINPANKPEAYNPSPPKTAEAPKATSQPAIENSANQSSNPYYTPYQQTNTAPYLNPYNNVETIKNQPAQ